MLVYTYRVLVILIGLVSSGICSDTLADVPTLQTNLSLSSKTYKFIPAPKKFGYQLPHKFILSNTEKVWVNNKKLLQRGIDFQIDYNKGEIIFLTSETDSTDIITVEYQYFGFPISQVYKHRSLPKNNNNTLPLDNPSVCSNSKTKTVLSNPIDFVTNLDSNYGLRVAGYKSIGVSIGSSKSFSLDQALEVNIRGRVTSDIGITANFSDQNMMLQPEGTTQELSEFDKARVELRTKRFTTTFGDYEIINLSSNFAQYQRKLKGAKTEILTNQSRLTAAGALSKGEFTTNIFYGQDGKQGPYKLTGKYGETEFVVIPGSERVWLDGEQLKPGANRDYIIDYDNGTLEFTTHRLITNRSHIIVDFEYTNDKYQRMFYFTQGNIPLYNNKIKLNTTFIHENDRKNKPLQFTLSTANKNVLQKIGDQQSQAWVSGVKHVGYGKGDYNLVDTDSLPIYVYVGTNNGNYQVSFTKVKHSQGDYIYNYVIGGFEYVGKGKGDHVPLVLLTLPTKHWITDVELQATPTELLDFSLESAISNKDLNCWSDKDDNDNIGYAFSLQGNLKPIDLSITNLSIGNLEITANLHTMDNNFIPMGRINTIEENYTANNNLINYQKKYLLKTTYTPVNGLCITSGYTRFVQNKIYTSIQKTIDASLNFNRLPKLKYRYSKVNSPTNNLLQRPTVATHSLDIHKSLWKIKPFGDYTVETTYNPYDNVQEQLYKYGIGVCSQGLSYIDMSMYYSLSENTSVFTNKRTRITNSVINHQIYKFNINRWRCITSRFQLQHRSKRSDEHSQINLATLELDFSPLNRAIHSEVLYGITQTEVAVQKEYYLKVEPGKGTYSKDTLTGTYYPDSNGDYRRIITPVGAPELTTKLTTSLNWSFNPELFLSSSKNRIPSLTNWLNILKWDCYIKLEEQTREPDKISLYLLRPNKFQRNNTTIKGTFTINNELTLSPHESPYSVILRFLKIDDEDNRFQSRHEDHIQLSRAVELKSVMNEMATVSMEYNRRNETRRTAEYGLELSNIADIITTKINYTLHKRYDIQTEVEYQHERIYHPYSFIGTRMITIYTKKISPQFTYYTDRNGVINSQIDVIIRSTDTYGPLVPLSLLAPNYLGTTLRWMIICDYKITDYLTLSLNYSGTRNPIEKTVHLGNVEIKSYF